MTAELAYWGNLGTAAGLKAWNPTPTRANPLNDPCKHPKCRKSRAKLRDLAALAERPDGETLLLLRHVGSHGNLRTEAGQPDFARTLAWACCGATSFA